MTTQPKATPATSVTPYDAEIGLLLRVPMRETTREDRDQLRSLRDKQGIDLRAQARALRGLAPLLTEAADALESAQLGKGPYRLDTLVVGFACECDADPAPSIDALAHTPDCPWAKARALVARLRAVGA